MNLLEKRQGNQGTLCSNYGALRLHVQRGTVFFASLPSRRLCWQLVGNTEIKKGVDICMGEKEARRCCGNDNFCKL